MTHLRTHECGRSHRGKSRSQIIGRLCDLLAVDFTAVGIRIELGASAMEGDLDPGAVDIRETVRNEQVCLIEPDRQ